MGTSFSIKNSKHEVTMDLEDGKSVLSFKVKDRRNATNPEHFIHYKRYKHFQLPVQIRNKFKTVRQFHQHLAQDASIITLGDKDVIIDLDGQKISVPFQNINEQSKIFCETQNIQMDNHRKDMSNQINIMVGSNGQGRRKHTPNGDNYEDCKDTIISVLKKIMKKNNPLKQPHLQNQDLRQLVQMLQEEWNKFEHNGGATVPNMTKKKTKEIDNEVQTLKKQIQTLTQQKQLLLAQFNCYKTCFNLQKFSQEQRKTEEKVQEKTRKRVMDDFFSDINEHFNRLSSSVNKSNITIQITTKAALFSRIQNTTKQLEQLRTKQIARNSTPSNHVTLSQKSSGVFTKKYEGETLDDNQKRQIQDQLNNF